MEPTACRVDWRERLCEAALPNCDRLAAAHRLNEAFARCRKRADAELLARDLGTPALFDALVQIVTEGEELSEIALQLMINLCIARENAKRICDAGVLPVLMGSLRIADSSFRLTGLALLSLLAEERELVPLLLRSGGLCQTYHFRYPVRCGCICLRTNGLM